jgi:hypothetical protein
MALVAVYLSLGLLSPRDSPSTFEEVPGHQWLLATKCLLAFHRCIVGTKPTLKIINILLYHILKMLVE